jgi:molybdopterin converting factor small subunit
MVLGEDIMVTVELSGIQRNIIKADKIDIPLSGKTTVRDALEYMRHKYPALPLDTNSVLVAINNELVPLDRLLMSEDVINILPHIGGG